MLGNEKSGLFIMKQLGRNIVDERIILKWILEEHCLKAGITEVLNLSIIQNSKN
jgi:hypothetical protein